jgi:hypothetical protein
MPNRDRRDLEPVQAREDVQNLLDHLTPMLKLAGVPETQINVAKGRRYKLKHFVDAFDWLHQFSLSPAYEGFVDVYSLREPEVWANYKILEIEGLAEQNLLQEAGKKLLKRWRVKRPRMFGKDKPQDAEEENEEEWSECDQD